ncbi:MAG: FKBP-type peptidyl-prolyl cis-trans isomerase [Bacteroidales bacterium]
MKRIIISTLVFAVIISLTSSCGMLKRDTSKSASNDILFNTTMDTVSYLIGQEIGSSFKSNFIDISGDALLKGVMDAVEGKTDLFSEEVKNDVMTAFQYRLQMAEMERREKVSAENRQEQETFMAENRKNPLIRETASGIQYKVIIPGEGEKPVATDTVRVHYEGRFVNGEVFDASRNHGLNPVEFPLNRVISGWTEALQLMPVGSTYELYIPADLGYGERGNDRIPPAKMLIFTVELIGIVK